MKQKNIILSALLLTAAVLVLLCGPAFAETASVSKSEAKYGFRFIAKSDVVTFSKGDTLKAVATDMAKLEAWLKTTPGPAKGADLKMIYKGDGQFAVQWKLSGKFERMRFAAASIELN
jgi:hypothetical protein